MISVPIDSDDSIEISLIQDQTNEIRVGDIPFYGENGSFNYLYHKSGGYTLFLLCVILTFLLCKVCCYFYGFLHMIASSH